MLLHLIFDDSKFFGRIERLFEKVNPGRNLFIVVREAYSKTVIPKCFEVTSSTRELERLVAERGEVTGVIINGLSQTMEPYVAKLPNSIPVAWYAYGFEIYNASQELSSSLCGDMTRQLSCQLSLKRILGKSLPLFVPRPLRWLFSFGGPRLKQLYRSLKRSNRRFREVDYFISALEEEYLLMRKHGGLPEHVRFHWGQVGSFEDLVDTSNESFSTGDNILLGNSASETNNHLEAFELVRRLDLGDRIVITPLSYGSVQYGEAIAKSGKQSLGFRFQPLLDFLPLEEYNELVQQCGFVIMNHYRQQAAGNVLASLWRGAKVFLNDTTLYHGLVRLGFDVKLIPRDLCPKNPDVFLPLDMNTKQKHRTLLVEHFGREKTIHETELLISRLKEFPKGAAC